MNNLNNNLISFRSSYTNNGYASYTLAPIIHLYDNSFINNNVDSLIFSNSGDIDIISQPIYL